MRKKRKAIDHAVPAKVDLERPLEVGEYRVYFCHDKSERIMSLRSFQASDLNVREDVAEMKALGYRVATAYEMGAFVREYPSLRREVWIFTDSKCVMRGDGATRAVDTGPSRRRYIDLKWLDGWWYLPTRALFIRNSPLVI